MSAPTPDPHEPGSKDELSPTKRALLALKQMQAKLARLDAAISEPIAIVGMSCRMPGNAETPERFWQLLADGRDTATPIPEDRWEASSFYDPDPDAPGKTYARQAHFLSAVDRFDPAFFGISPGEAIQMDPRQRLLLEVSWEALERAGQPPDKLRSTASGVFFGLADNEYTRLTCPDPARVDMYTDTGQLNSMAAGRLAYFLGLHGPALVVDTACSSSLVALHLAITSLRSRECDLALAGGADLLLTPMPLILVSRVRALAPDGRCKTFDAGADGYGRGEGVGVIVLKRLSDARAAGDPIIAQIRGAAINHDGATSGLTAPSRAAQEAVIRQALANARVSPDEVGYIETHGTGTPLGDAIEVAALGAVFGKRTRPLVLGSVKTNIGHLEAAAGIAGVIKTALALQHKQIPGHLHLQRPNPHIRWDDFSFTIHSANAGWEPVLPDGKRIAGVSSFGFSGTNAHVIMQEAPERPARLPETAPRTNLLCLSARTREALAACCRQWADFLDTRPELVLEDVCFTANTGRTHFDYRVCLPVKTMSAAIVGLRQAAWESEQPTDSKRSAALSLGVAGKPAIRFHFSAHGSLARMDRMLLENSAAYRRAIETCQEHLDPGFRQSLSDMLHPASARSPIGSDRVPVCQFAVQYALAAMWRSWGIECSDVMGQGLGEITAACVAGVFGLREALALAQACGPSAPLGDHAGLLPQAPLPAAEPSDFQQITNQIYYSSAAVTILSARTGKEVTGEVASGDYWRGWLRDTAIFPEETAETPQIGGGTTLHIAPATVAPGTGGETSWDRACQTLAGLYRAGADVDWAAYHRDQGRGRKILLPTYPFQRRRYWVDTSPFGSGEAKRKQAPGDGPGPESSPIFRALNAGDGGALTALLERTGRLTTEQKAHLPEIVDLLVREHRQHPVRQLMRLPEALRRQQVTGYLQAAAARVLGLADPPAPEQDLTDAGLDSLTALDLQIRLSQLLGISVSPEIGIEHTSIAQWVDHIMENHLNSGQNEFGGARGFKNSGRRG